MAVRLFPKTEVEGKLTALGCVKLKDYSHGSGSLWVTRKGFYFSVPQWPDGRTDQNSLQAILAQIQGR